MNIQNQVVSLELAKQLKKLGVEQESQFYWVRIAGKWKVQWFNFGKKFSEEVAKRKDLISAFTVAELGEMLEKTKQINFIKAYLSVMDLEEYHIKNDYALMAHNLMTQPNISAEMLIYLIENNLIKL